MLQIVCASDTPRITETLEAVGRNSSPATMWVKIVGGMPILLDVCLLIALFAKALELQRKTLRSLSESYFIGPFRSFGIATIRQFRDRTGKIDAAMVPNIGQ
jgi:hypothetical protein